MGIMGKEKVTGQNWVGAASGGQGAQGGRGSGFQLLVERSVLGSSPASLPPAAPLPLLQP